MNATRLGRMHARSQKLQSHARLAVQIQRFRVAEADGLVALVTPDRGDVDGRDLGHLDG